MTGPELRAWRHERGLTQVQLAELLEVHEYTVRRWETGVHAVPAYLERALATIWIPRDRGEE